MAEKQKTRDWKDPKTIIAAVSITMLVTIWNTFASHDRGRVEDKGVFVSTPSPTAEATADNTCPTPQAQNPGKGCVPVTSTRSS
ncbi:MAG TPA: hypothetical protein VLE49_09645 [Anaerolineales bacterium]|nr:hypothetical protein [Anaerolineales bacterium]